MSIKFASVLATASSIALAAPALAQTAPVVTDPSSSSPAAQHGSTDQPNDTAPGPETEIVVTAQKRVERVQDVPLSITVASQAQLERQQVNTVSDLARVSPALEVQQAPGQNVGGGGEIRGIGTQSFQAGAVGSVGIVVDQVSQGNVNISDLFDVARVEVLKGPQGTLFGLTTSAGVINITTNAPDPSRFSGRVRTELSAAGTAGSEFGNQIVQGVVNIPISDNAAIRASANVNLRQGVDRNAENDDNYAQHRTYGGRARLLWKPTDRITINLIGDYTHINENADFFVITRAGSPLTQSLLSACGISAAEGNRKYCSTSQYAQKSQSYGGSAQIDYDAGPFTISSISSLRLSHSYPVFDDIFRLDTNPLQIASDVVARPGRLFTQELRLSSPAHSRLEYTVGAFFSHSTFDQGNDVQHVTLSPAPGVVIPLATNDSGFAHTTDDSLAVFGQGTFHIDDHLSIIAGGRYTSERLGLDILFPGVDSASHQFTSPSNLSWKGGARYEFSRNLNVYGFVSRGYKGPQVNIPTLPTNPATVINPEVPTDYEVGSKGSLFDGKLNFDFSAFYIKLKGYQGQDCEQGPPPTNTLVCNVTNISHITSKGLEGNIFGSPLPGLSLNAGLIYDEVLYPGGYLDSTKALLGGDQVAFAPRWKGTFSGEYSHDLTTHVQGFVAGDIVYKSRLRLNTFVNKDVTFRPHALVGGRIGVRTEDQRYSVSVFGRNLFNVHEPVTIYTDFPNGGDLGSILTPQSFRQVGLQLDGKF